MAESERKLQQEAKASQHRAAAKEAAAHRREQAAAKAGNTRSKVASVRVRAVTPNRPAPASVTAEEGPLSLMQRATLAAQRASSARATSSANRSSSGGQVLAATKNRGVAKNPVTRRYQPPPPPGPAPTQATAPSAPDSSAQHRLLLRRAEAAEEHLQLATAAFQESQQQLAQLQAEVDALRATGAGVPGGHGGGTARPQCARN